MTYPIVKLLDDAPTQCEQLGTKAKFWYRDESGQRMLFKEGRPGTGENWAEKICCEICSRLDIPHAEYNLAVWRDKQGVVTPSFVPEGSRLVLGNELLAKIIDDYGDGKRYQMRQHTVRTVMKVASVAALPLAWTAPSLVNDAAGVFVGYLMLDALVGNQDRHDENWGLVWVSDRGVFLAPTFDHASSLGRNETDQVRQEMLTSRDKGRSVETYVARAKSALFASPSNTKPMKTLEAFLEAAKIRPEAADYWTAKLAILKPDDFKSVLADVPDTVISAPAREFAQKMLEVNMQRILNTRQSI